jgi:Septum formation
VAGPKAGRSAGRSIPAGSRSMAKSWKCPRCSTTNDESQITCSRCGLLQGSVYVPTTWDAPPTPRPPPTPPPSPPPPETVSGWSVPEPQAEGTVRPADDLPAASEALAGGASGAAGDNAPPFSDWTPVGGAQPQVPAAKIPLWRRIPIGLIVFLVIALGGGISSWFFGADRGETGEIAKPGDLTATDLRVGDCFDLKDPNAEEIDDVAARPCAQAHEFEMFFIGSMPEGPYPSQSAFDAFLDTHCVPAFRDYIGKAYEDSALDVYWLVPTTEGWGLGNRSIQCAVFHPEIHQLTESLMGSKR